MRWHSGLFVVIALAIACSTSVLPALGGETMRPRWPFPIGATRSMIRVLSTLGSVSSRSRFCGYSGVSLPNSSRLRASSTLWPLMASTWTIALYLPRRSSPPGRSCLTWPTTASPLRRPYFLTWARET